MPSIFSHPAIPISLCFALGSDRISLRLFWAAATASVLPDIDSVGFLYGVPYGALFGHRGFTHSLLFALIIASAAAQFSRFLKSSPLTVFSVIFVSLSSHGILDALTSGGPGVAFLSPFSNERYFFPWRPITVSPLSISRFFSSWGLQVILSELKWIWFPCLLLSFCLHRLKISNRST